MKSNKVRSYSDKLLEDKNFREKFEQEYENLIVSEKIAELRHKACLTQEELAEKIHTTKSAISRYENNDYNGYSVALLQRIATACNAKLQIAFIAKK